MAETVIGSQEAKLDLAFSRLLTSEKHLLGNQSHPRGGQPHLRRLQASLTLPNCRQEWASKQTSWAEPPNEGKLAAADKSTRETAVETRKGQIFRYHEDTAAGTAAT